MTEATRAHRVLMIEDNPVDVAILRMAFDEMSDWVLDTTVASDGEQAMRLLEEQAQDPQKKADLVLLDLNLPRRDGTEVLTFIRNTQNLADLPVAILSSSPRDVIQRKLTVAGVTADGHFTKPLELTEFIALGRKLRSWYEERRCSS